MTQRSFHSPRVYEAPDGKRLLHLEDIERRDHGSVYSRFQVLDTGEMIEKSFKVHKKWKDLGPDMEEAEIVMPSEEIFAKESDFSFLDEKDFTYFEDLLEGKENIVSYLVWFASQQKRLCSHLTRTDYMGFYPRGGIQKSLDKVFLFHAKEIPQISPRYRWLLEGY